MRVFLLSGNADGGIYKLSQKERRYLFSVLRLNVNDVFTAKDKNGDFYKAFLFSEDSMTLERTENPENTLLDSLSSYKGPLLPITMMVSVLKNKKNETEIRMLTEMGVRKIVLMNTEFTEGYLNDHQKERLSLIMREAVQQSGANLPELIGPIPFSEALKEAEGRLMILHQGIRKDSSSIIKAMEGSSSATAMIGPEGGFSDSECEEAERAGAIPVLLKTNILRSETAAVYAASAIQTILQETLS